MARKKAAIPLTRAEIIRQRKAQRKPKPVSRQKKRGGSMASLGAMPPTFVRGRKAAVPSSRSRPKRRKQERRKIHFALDVPGAEVGLPSLPVVRFGWRGVSGLMVVSLAVLVYWMWSAPAFQVGTVELAGAERLTPEEVNRVLNITGRPVFGLDPESLAWNLQQAFPELSSVVLKVGFPSRVIALVEERKPLIVWLQGEVIIWIDADGIAFLPRGEVEGLVKVHALGSPPDLAQDEEAEEVAPRFLTVELVTAILIVDSQAPAGAPILFDPEHGLGWEDPQGWQVFFGNTGEDMVTRLQIYQTLVEVLNEKNIRPALISLEYLHTPFYRMER